MWEPCKGRRARRVTLRRDCGMAGAKATCGMGGSVPFGVRVGNRAGAARSERRALVRLARRQTIGMKGARQDELMHN